MYISTLAIIAVYVGIEVSIYNVCYQGVVLQYVHTMPTVLLACLLFNTTIIIIYPSLPHFNIEI